MSDLHADAVTLTQWEVHSVLMWWHAHTDWLASIGAQPTGQDQALAARLEAAEAAE